MKEIVKVLTRIIIPFFFGINISNSATYYVAINGNDSYTNALAQNTATPWKTIAKVNTVVFVPGDTICFRRGDEWTGQLNISRSGTQAKPILFTAYGIGANPSIKNPGVVYGAGINITADWIIVENFLLHDVMEAGINLRSGADYNIIRNNEATKVGIGVAISGKHNLITHNYAHDLVMVVNDPGGDNDFGAVGIWLYASNNEVSYNKMLNCIAPSYDYVTDGGMVEYYGDVDSSYVHHNWGEHCNGAFEVGGNGQTLTDNIVAYNVSINNIVSGGFHNGGAFSVFFKNFRVENNVFVDTSAQAYTIGFWGGTPKATEFVYRNNIFYVPKCQAVSNAAGFTHQNNLYYLGGKTNVGLTPGTGDKIGDPLFVNLINKNYHLQPGSPAIDAGANLNYSIDYDGNPVPVGPAPDMGAFEYSMTTAQNEMANTGNNCIIYPNPFSTTFILKFSDAINIKNDFLKIYDVCGREVKAVSINSNETVIDNNELQSGIYFYSIFNNFENIANGKVVVQ